MIFTGQKIILYETVLTRVLTVKKIFCPVDVFTPVFVCSVGSRQRGLHGSVFRSESVNERNKPKHIASMNNSTSQFTEKHE